MNGKISSRNKAVTNWKETVKNVYKVVWDD